MSVVGIDFGDTSVVIAVAQKGGIDVIMNEVSSRQTPTMAAFGEKERYLGEPASTQYLRNIKNTIAHVKRLLGRKFSDPEVQKELKDLPFKAIELPNNEIGIEVMYQNEKKVFTPVTITAMILQKAKEITEKATDKPCNDVVIGVPGWWTDRQRRAMLDASRIAGLNSLRLFNELTACALSYGIYKSNQFHETEPTRVMFYDMGSSTTGAAIVEFLKGKLRIVAAAYNHNLGGRDFDNVLTEHFLKEFQDKYKLDIKSNQKAYIRLQLASEKLKKLLNTVPEAPISVESIMNDIDVKGMLKRSDFEGMIASLLDKAMEPVQKVLEMSGLTSEQLSAIEIAGGSTRLMPVQHKLAAFLKRDISKTLNFEEAIARGCALQCAMLSPVFKVREFSVTDICPYPIKLSWKSPDQMQVDESKDSTEIFAKNNVVPSTKVVSLPRNSPVELIAEYADASLLPPGIATQIGTFSVNEVKVADNVKLRVKVKLDLNSIFVVEGVEQVETLEDQEAPATPSQTESTEQKSEEPTPMQDATPTTPSTPPTTPAEGEKKEEKKKKVKRTNLSVKEVTASLPLKELQNLVEEEAKMVSSDRLAIETAEKKNAVESYVYEMRNKLNDSLHEFSTEQERNALSTAFEATESWLYGEGEDATKSVYVKKLDELKALGDPIVKRKNESENRYEALNNIKSTIEQWRMTATSADPKYDHIPKEERDKVTQEVNNTEKWVTEQMMKQDRVPKNANPVVLVADINKKQADLTRFASVIMNKPKPVEKPKEAEKKPEEQKPEEQKPEDKKPETQNSDKKPDAEMDLD